MVTFTVDQNSAGQRLDLYLTLSSGQFSRSRVRQLLDAGKVQINGKIEFRPNYKVNKEDVVILDSDIVTQKKHVEPYKLKLKFVYQDDDLVIVDKPSGLKVHPTAAEDTESLLNAIYYNLDGKLGEYGANLINRIDKDTSGLVAVAISPKGAWFYSRQFAESKVKKEYIAVVSGNWISYHGFSDVRVSGFLRYDALMERQVVDKERGEFAETKFKLLKTSEDKKLAVILAQPTTGRTHQIRVHLQELGFPIVGDTKYEGPEGSRLMLHAYRLVMAKPDGGTLEATSEIPPEFNI